MRGRRVPDRMGAHSLGGQSWHLDRHPTGIALDQRMNAESGNRSATAIEKDVLRGSPRPDPRGQLAHRVWPQGATAQLVALTADLYRGGVPLRRVGQLEV